MTNSTVFIVISQEADVGDEDSTLVPSDAHAFAGTSPLLSSSALLAIRDMTWLCCFVPRLNCTSCGTSGTIGVGCTLWAVTAGTTLTLTRSLAAL